MLLQQVREEVLVVLLLNLQPQTSHEPQATLTPLISFTKASSLDASFTKLHVMAMASLASSLYLYGGAMYSILNSTF